jgi:hypothetical protein
MDPNKLLLGILVSFLSIQHLLSDVVRITPFELDDVVIFQKRTMDKNADWVVEESRVSGNQIRYFDGWVERMKGGENLVDLSKKDVKIPDYYFGSDDDIGRSPLSGSLYQIIRFKDGKIVWFLRVFPSSKGEIFRNGAKDLIKKTKTKEFRKFKVPSSS